MPAYNQLKPLPQSESVDKEREFWSTHDSMEYLDWDSAENTTFTNLQPSTKTISLRLPGDLLSKIDAKQMMLV